MIDYNNSENASSLIGMLKQGGGLVNIEDEQTITGRKDFKYLRVAADSETNRVMSFTAYTIKNVPSDGWIRIGEYEHYTFNALLAISSVWATSRYSSALISIIDNYKDISYNLLNKNTELGYIKGVRIKSDNSASYANLRYICLNFNDNFSDEKGVLTLSAINFSYDSPITWYETPVIDTDIEGYTNYDLDLVSST